MALGDTMPDDLLTRLNNELAPTEAAIERVLARVVANTTTEPTPSTPRARSRRRRPSIRIGVAAVGAAGVALVVALSPFESSRDRPAVPGLAAAQAALERAGDAAGAVDWTPLGAGQYHHTMSVQIDPDIPRRPGDPEHLHADDGLGNASATETFLDRNGHGMEIRTMGGNGDPDSIPFLVSGTEGTASGWGFRGDGVTPNTPVGSIDEQLRFAYSVGVRSWPRDGDPSTTNWIRQRDGFIEGSAFPGGAIPKAGLSLGQRFQRDLWGAPLSTIDELNMASRDELTKLLDTTLSPTPDGELAVSGPLVGVSGYDETRAWFQAQVEVQNAVKLLAKAPLAPSVRAAIFDRLARSEHVSLDRDVADERGRRGTRITFEWLLDEKVPAFTITKEQLRADAVTKRQPADGPISGPDRVSVDAHRSVGRWYHSIIIDERAGSILQNEEWVDWKTTVDLPRVATTTRRDRPVNGVGWNVGIRFEPGWYGTGGGEVFVIRERATDFGDVRSPACEITPRMCR